MKIRKRIPQKVASSSHPFFPSRQEVFEGKKQEQEIQISRRFEIVRSSDGNNRNETDYREKFKDDNFNTIDSRLGLY